MNIDQVTVENLNKWLSSLTNRHLLYMYTEFVEVEVEHYTPCENPEDYDILKKLGLTTEKIFKMIEQRMRGI